MRVSYPGSCSFGIFGTAAKGGTRGGREGGEGLGFIRDILFSFKINETFFKKIQAKTSTLACSNACVCLRRSYSSHRRRHVVSHPAQDSPPVLLLVRQAVEMLRVPFDDPRGLGDENPRQADPPARLDVAGEERL